VLASPPPGLSATTFVHLEDLNGHRWSQAEQDAYPAEQWAVGETIVQRVDVPVPPGAPPGENGIYRLRLGLFDPASGARLPFTDAATGLTTDAATTEAVAISAGPPPEPLPRPPFAVYETVAGGLTFLGYERGAEALETGEVIDVGLWWSAEEALPYLLMNMTLVGVDNGVDNGIVYPFGQAQPFYNLFPFSQWPTPIFVIDRQIARIPDDVATGNYRLRLELFDGAGQTALPGRPRPAGHHADGARIHPAAVGDDGRRIIRRRDRPAGLHADRGRRRLGAGTGVAGGGAAGGRLHRLRPRPARRRHVLPWQADAMPRGGAYPTSRWLAGEVVTDTYAIALPGDTPPGEYPIEVGLYRAETGARLPVAINGQAAGDAARLTPLLIGP
jgi:hypothetical protein